MDLAKDLSQGRDALPQASSQLMQSERKTCSDMALTHRRANANDFTSEVVLEMKTTSKRKNFASRRACASVTLVVLSEEKILQAQLILDEPTPKVTLSCPSMRSSDS